MTTLICIVWLVLIILTGMAFWKGKIFLAKDEEVLRDEMEKLQGSGSSDKEKGIV